MTNIKNKLKAVEEEREASIHQIEKFKKDYAKSLVANRDEMLEQINHPQVITKKDIRVHKRHRFFNKLKKALGINDTEVE